MAKKELNTKRIRRASLRERIILLLVASLTMACGFVQSDEPEKSSPSRDTEIVRRCSYMDIEGKYYKNCVVTLKSTSPDYFITDKYKVKVLVKDENGKKVYKKTFSNAYLYIYSNGQVQVGQPKFHQIIIGKAGDSWYGEINEKEGIW